MKIIELVKINTKFQQLFLCWDIVLRLYALVRAEVYE